MGKLLRISDYILLFAAFSTDLVSEIKLILDIRPELLKARYGFVPAGFKKDNYWSTVSKMMSSGDINKKNDNNGQSFLELTSQGVKKFKRRFPLMGLKRKIWDECFTVTIFDIPEVKRNDRYIVRKKLEALGFAMLQESVWVSPYNFEEELREFFVNQGLSQQVYILKAQSLLTGNLASMVSKTWKLDQLDRKYQQVIDKCRKLTNLKDAEKNEESKNILILYLETLRKDPFLPEKIDSLRKIRQDVSHSIKALL